MKIKLISAMLLCASLTTQAQTTTTDVLIEENFEDGFFGGCLRGGSVSFYSEDETPKIKLNYSKVYPENYAYFPNGNGPLGASEEEKTFTSEDHIVGLGNFCNKNFENYGSFNAEYTLGFEENTSILTKLEENHITTTNSNSATPSSNSYNETIHLTSEITFNLVDNYHTEIIKDRTYLTIELVEQVKNEDDYYNLVESSINSSYTLGEFTSSNPDEVFYGFCSTYYSETEQECIEAYYNLNLSTTISYENVTFTGTKNQVISGINQGHNPSEKEIFQVFNLLGQEKDITDKGEILLVKYTDGSSERVYNK